MLYSHTIPHVHIRKFEFVACSLMVSLCFFVVVLVLVTQLDGIISQQVNIIVMNALTTSTEGEFSDND